MLRTLSLCTCRRQYPGAAAERRLRSSHPAVSAFPEIAVGSACTSSFSRLARRSLALRPAHSRRHLYVTRYTEGFSHFVTSMTAPVASGWSVRRVGLSPTGKRRLLTAHTLSGHREARRRRTQLGHGGRGRPRPSIVEFAPIVRSREFSKPDVRSKDAYGPLADRGSHPPDGSNTLRAVILGPPGERFKSTRRRYSRKLPVSARPRSA